MAFSGGVYTLPAGNPVVTGTTISSSTMNTTLSDIATALSTCMLKDGSQTITANIPMGAFKFTGLGAGSTTGDSLRYEQVFSGSNLAIAATQAQQETSTSTAVAVTPAVQQFHPSAAKVWCEANYAGTILVSYNMTSITDAGIGDTTFTIATDFSSSNWEISTAVIKDPGGTAATTYLAQVNGTGYGAGSVRIQTVKVSDGTNADGDALCFVGFGDQP